MNKEELRKKWKGMCPTTLNEWKEYKTCMPFITSLSIREIDRLMNLTEKKCIKRLEKLDKKYSCGCYAIAIEAIRN